MEARRAHPTGVAREAPGQGPGALVSGQTPKGRADSAEYSEGAAPVAGCRKGDPCTRTPEEAPQNP